MQLVFDHLDNDVFFFLIRIINDNDLNKKQYFPILRVTLFILDINKHLLIYITILNVYFFIYKTFQKFRNCSWLDDISQKNCVVYART